MRVMVAVLLVVAMAGPAVSETPSVQKKRAILLGEMAFTFGGCEHHFSKEQADTMVSAITMESSEPKSTGKRAVGQFYASFYAKGRKDPQLAALDAIQCERVLQSITDDLNSLAATSAPTPSVQP